MNSKLLEAGLVLAIMVVVVSGFAQSWTKTGAPNVGGGYFSLAASADGRIIIAVTSTAAPTVSTDSGATWHTNTIFNWFNRIACTPDGTKWVAAFYSANTNISVSGNSGNTWSRTASAVSSAWNAVAISADGNKLFAAVLNGSIYASTNFGTNWVVTGAPTKAWNALAVSADGARIAAAANDKIYLSTNSGTTWSAATASGSGWTSIAGTPDGTRLIASAGDGTYISTNSGGSWGLANTNSGQVLSSADGARLVIGGTSIYTSSDSGTTWVSNSAPSALVVAYSGITASADGCRLFAARYGTSGIWTSQNIPSPNLTIGGSAANTTMLSWLVPSTNFVLQQNVDLGTANWVTMSNTPVLNLTNLQEELMLPASNSSSFFRLMAQ